MAKQKKQTVPENVNVQIEEGEKVVLSEFVIKEIMIQKSVTREEAIDILQNPTK